MTDETNRAKITQPLPKIDLSQIDAEASQASGRQKPERPGASRRRWRKAGFTFGAVACFLSMAVGSVFGHFWWGSAAFRELFRNHGLEAAKDALTGQSMLNSWTPERQFKNQSTLNLLVLGIDHDYDNKAQIIKNTWGRSDAILLARVDFINKTINALTIPRDSAVRIPGYRGIHKINAAHSYRGPELTVETIKSVFGVQADSVVSVNFEGFQKVVDAIGGVDVNVTKKLDYDDNWGNLHVHLKPGFQHLTGYQAMGYVRIRKLDSDLMRSQRQHEFLEAVRNKVKAPSTFLALPKVIDELNDNLSVHRITRDQMFTLINFARTLPRESIHVETLPSIEGRSFVSIDTEKSKEVIERLFFPNQVVALNIEAPDVSGNGRSSSRRRRSRPHRSEYVRPSSGLHVETPTGESQPSSSDSGKPQGEPSQAPGDDTGARTEESGAARGTG